MLPTYAMLREKLSGVIANQAAQGHVVNGLVEELAALPDSYDASWAFAGRLAALPIRDDWPYIEPSDLDAIRAESDPDRQDDPIAEIDPSDAAARAEAAFVASCAGCVLGKPLEFGPVLADIRAAAEPLGEWPLNDYVPEALLEAMGNRHVSWAETTRGNIRHVAPDDDINYTVMGMLLLEDHGVELTPDHVRAKWIAHLPVGACWGPEKTMIVKSGLAALAPDHPVDLDTWVEVLNPGNELCGALIRADAYGYACPGRPALAAELAWQDSRFTHRRTGIYGTMFTAAAIATAFVADDPLQPFDVALQHVPQKSRFHEIAADCLARVRAAGDWLDGYERIHGEYGQYGHCHIYQEAGTLMNTMRFAGDIGEGFCMQVAQGNDTDSFGCTVGSLLGAYFGPGRLEDRWIEPFNDTIHVGMSGFYDQSLSRLAKRMGELPARIAQQL